MDPILKTGGSPEAGNALKPAASRFCRKPLPAQKPESALDPRRVRRLAERELESLPASIRLRGSEAFLEARLWDISPFGIGLLLPLPEPGSFFHTGSDLEFRLMMPDGFEAEALGRIENLVHRSAALRLGIKRVDIPFLPAFPERASGRERQGLPFRFLSKTVTVETPHPFLFRERCRLVLKGATAAEDGRRTYLLESGEASFIAFPDQDFRLRLALPRQGEAVQEVTVTRVFRSADSRLLVEAEGPGFGEEWEALLLAEEEAPSLPRAPGADPAWIFGRSQPVKFRLGGAGEWLEADLENLTGLTLALCGAAPALRRFGLEVGEELEFEIRLGRREPWSVRGQIRSLETRDRGFRGEEGLRLEIRRLDSSLGLPQGGERRRSPRLDLDMPGLLLGLSLQVFIRSPLSEGRFHKAFAVNINRNMGMSLLAAEGHTVLFAGMEVEVALGLPGTPGRPGRARIRWVKTSESRTTLFGLQPEDMDLRQHDALCAFLLASEAWTPQRLREYGFRTRHLERHLHFRTVHSRREYEEVLSLRHLSLALCEGITPQTPPAALAEPLDEKSRILIAYHQDHGVACLSFAFPDPDDPCPELEAFAPMGKALSFRPPPGRFALATGLCLRPGFGDGDILSGLLEHGVKAFLLSERDWLLVPIDPSLRDDYHKAGFRAIGRETGRRSRAARLLMMAHRADFTWRPRGNPFAWSLLYGDLVEYLLERNLLELTGWRRGLVALKLRLRPLARLVGDRRMKAAFRRHLRNLSRRETRSGRPAAP